MCSIFNVCFFTCIRIGEVNPNFGHPGGGIQVDLQVQFIGEFNEIGKVIDWSFTNE